MGKNKNETKPTKIITKRKTERKETNKQTMPLITKLSQIHRLFEF